MSASARKVDGYFNSGLFEETIDSLDALISSHIEADPTAFYDYDAYKRAVIELKKLGLLRAESIEGQLNGTIPSTSERQNADSSKLVDASSINLSSLGSQGGGGGMGRQPPENAKGEGNNLTAGQNQGVGSRHATVTSGFDTNTWLFIGGCTILLLIGIFSVSFFKRRRYS